MLLFLALAANSRMQTLDNRSVVQFLFEADQRVPCAIDLEFLGEPQGLVQAPRAKHIVLNLLLIASYQMSFTLAIKHTCVPVCVGEQSTLDNQINLVLECSCYDPTIREGEGYRSHAFRRSRFGDSVL